MALIDPSIAGCYSAQSRSVADATGVAVPAVARAENASTWRSCTLRVDINWKKFG
jgi:hypothetical protein